jgi:endonuclease/exonuclease/phosphatase family metal-dependent hydrolase
VSRSAYGSSVRSFVLALIALLLVVRSCGCREDTPQRLRIATFNIENFPKSTKQIAGAFDEIQRLDAPIIGVQEITNPEVFTTAARRRLGEHWRFEFIETGSVLEHRLGVLYNSRVVRHVKTRVHDGTRLEGQQKPVLDVEFAHGGGHIRVLVLHLKAGGENHPVRTRQYAALRAILAKVKKDGMPVVLLGDFNATGDADREDLSNVDLRWLTQPLACTAFRTQYNDGCPRSRLDHVLSTQPAVEVRAFGGCATDGCDWQDRCPLYATQVSDHCPVLVEVEH